MTTRGRARTWTEEQLKTAVADQRSWHGVLRQLGLKPTSTNSLRRIKQTVETLELDTSHFTGQRRWSDIQLRDAVMRATTWTDVLRLLDVNDDGSSHSTVKAHALRLLLDTSHLQRVAVDDELPADLFTSGTQPSMLRVAAGSIATAWFLLRNMAVSVPVEPEIYDLLVTMPDGIQRVQVKSTTHRTKSGAWEVGVGRRPYVLDKTAKKIPYDPGSIDYFFIIDGVGRIFLIPSLVLAGRVNIYLDSYATYCVGDASSLLR